MGKAANFSARLFLLSAILMSCFLFSSMRVLAQPDEIVLDNAEFFGNKKKPAVMFPHAAHMDKFGCLQCHHRIRNGENVLDEGDLEEDSPGIQCKECHGRENYRFSSESDATQRGLMQAYHKQCISCHRKSIDQKGPRTCNGCHKK
jgi:hypothetical protein